MSHWRPIFHVDAFTHTPFSGNPAAVVPDADDLDPVVMQRIAREMKMETAFVLASTVADWRLRWWAPLTEVPLCGHGTVAACHVLAELGRLQVPGVYQVETPAGVLGVELRPNDHGVCEVWFDIPIPDWEPSQVLPVALAGALRIDEKKINHQLVPMRGSSIMYVAMHSLFDLLALKPDFTALDLLSRTHDVYGWAFYALQGVSQESIAHLRFFAPQIGINEDPVTGAAQGPLGALLVGAGLIGDNGSNVVEYQAEQGDAISRPGRVKVEVTRSADGTPIRSRIGGVAVTVTRGELATGA